MRLHLRSRKGLWLFCPVNEDLGNRDVEIKERMTNVSRSLKWSSTLRWGLGDLEMGEGTDAVQFCSNDRF